MGEIRRMHEAERHRMILSAVRSRPVLTVAEAMSLTGASEATARRDIATLDTQQKLRRVRGGAEALAPPAPGYAGAGETLAGRSWEISAGLNRAEKQIIARAAVDLCADGEAIIINGGTTTFQMVHPLAGRQLQVFTNSFPIADHLLHQSRNTVMLPAGTIYRAQQIILSPFDSDGSRNFRARRMFMGAEGIGPMGIGEADPLLARAEEKLIGQADELVVLADATKFDRTPSLIVRPLDAVSVLITDDRISDASARTVEAAGVRLIVVDRSGAQVA